MNQKFRRATALVITAIMLLSMIPLGTLAEIVSGFSSGFSMSKAAPFVHTKTYEFWVEGDGIPTKLVDTQIVKNGQSLIAPATPEAPDGTKFTGWFVGNDKVLFNDPIEVNANTPDKVEAKAKFTPVAYVYFVYNGNVIATKEVPPGTKTDSSGVPITVNIPGKVLSHWSDTVDGSAFDFAGTNIDGDTSLYAVLIDQWEVSFNTHGGTTILPQYVVHNGKATKPSDNPTRLGYTFKHWSTTENGAQAYSFNTSVTDKLTLHAVWNAGNANYSVVYWMQDIDDTDNTKYTYLETATGSGQVGNETSYATKSYTGFTLNTNKTNAAANKTYILADGTAIKNVYYNRNTYTFTILRNNQPYSSTPLRYGESTKVPYNAAVDAYPNYLWYISATSGIAYSEAPVMGAQDLTVYGRYSGNIKYIIRYHEKSGNQSTSIHPDYVFYAGSGLSFTIEDGIGIAGFTVDPNVNNWSALSGYNPRTGTIYYTRNKYSITFKKNNNTNDSVTANIPYQASIADKALAGFTEGVTTYEKDEATHTFGGWYESPSFEEGTKFSFAGKTMPADNILLYAKWVPPVHTAKYYRTPSTSGEFGVITNIPHRSPIGAGTGSPSYDIPEGMTDDDFAGWYWYVGSIFVPYDFDRPVSDSSIVIYPVWKDKAYKVTYQANNGTVDEFVDPTFYTLGSSATVKNKQSGWENGDLVFIGWNTAANKSGDFYYPNSMLPITGNMTLYAQWEDILGPVWLTYRSNFPEGPQATDVEKGPNFINETLAVEGNLFTEPEDYSFDGWNTKADGSGDPYSPNDKVIVDNDGDNILYAKWKHKPTITVTANSAEKVYDGNPLTLTNNDYTYTGTLFPGHTLQVTISGTITDVGTTANGVGTVKVMSGGNDVTHLYKINKVNGTLEVTKRPIELTAASASKTYDGTPLTAATQSPTYTISSGTFVDSQGLASVSVAGSQTLVGSSASTITGHTLKPGTNANNYSITYKPGTLTVTTVTKEVVVTITGNTGTFTYDGNPHTVTDYTVSISDPLYTAADFTFSGTASATRTEVGTTNMGLADTDFANTNTNFTNVVFNVTDGWVKMNKRPVTLTSATDSKVYDGTALTNNTVDVTGDGWATGEGATYDVTGSQTVVGSSANAFTYTLNTGTNPDNYDITKTEGTLTVTKAEIPLILTGNSDETMFNGLEQNVTGYSSSGLLTGHTISSASTLSHEAKGTLPGNYAGIFDEGTLIILDENDNDVTENYVVTKIPGNLFIKLASMTVQKTAAEESYDAVGDVLHYTVVITNTGNVKLTNLVVTDTLVPFADMALTESISADGDLDVGETWTLTYSYTVTQADLDKGSVYNAVSAYSPEYPDNPGEDEEEVPADQKPSASVTKTAMEESYDAAGDELHYTVLVTNTGNITLKNLVITDTLVPFADMTLTESISADGDLDVGETWTLTYTYIVTQADLDAGSVLNKVTVTKPENPDNPDEPDLPPTEDEEEVPADQQPLMTVLKTAAEESFDAVGDSLNYEVRITNTGNVTLTNLVITDTLVPFADMTLIESISANGHLDVGETWTLTYSYTITQADLERGFVFNRVTAVSPEYPDDPVSDEETVEGIIPPPVPVPTFDFGAVTSNIADCFE